MKKYYLDVTIIHRNSKKPRIQSFYFNSLQEAARAVLTYKPSMAFRAVEYKIEEREVLV